MFKKFEKCLVKRIIKSEIVSACNDNIREKSNLNELLDQFVILDQRQPVAFASIRVDNLLNQTLVKSLV